MIEFYETTYDMETKKRADIEGVLFGQEDCAPGHGYGPTLRPYHLFHFITGGRGLLRIDGLESHLGAGDAFLIPAEQVAYYEASAAEPWSYAWAGFAGLRATQYVQQLLAAAPERYVLRGLDTPRFTACIDRAAGLAGTSLQNHLLCQLVVYEIFFLLAGELPRLDGAERSPSLAARAKFFLDAKFMENLRMEELAGRFGVHPNHLSRVFRDAYGLPPKRYVQKLRLEKAALMLSGTDMPVALVAESLGFEDQHAFSKIFKKYWGLSPLAYRKEQTPCGY